jgi:hypothetical protein
MLTGKLPVKGEWFMKNKILQVIMNRFDGFLNCKKSKEYATTNGWLIC